ncbi:MAG TPA: phage tail tube protein [Burkholderiales bacterium]|nr:phage tail tube protein [Burkholderiales bacterium]
MSEAVAAQDTKFSYASLTVSPSLFIEIPEIKSFSGPNGQSNLIDVTNLRSTGKEYLVGLKDEGEIQLTVNLVPGNAVHQALRAAWSNRTKLDFQIEFADLSPQTKWYFQGYVSGFSATGAVDGVLEGSITLKITGAISQVN